MKVEPYEWISIKDKEPPKDGTPFLCYDPNSDENSTIYVVVWKKSRWIDEPDAYIESGGECYFRWNPTHWMPLPLPPKKENKK